MNFRGKVLKIPIDDVDKTLLIDVINELEEKAERIGLELLEYPMLCYASDMKSYYLNSDKDLLNILELLRKMQQRIKDIWIRCCEYLTKFLTFARSVTIPIRFESPIISLATSPMQHVPLKNKGVNSKPITPTAQRNVISHLEGKE